MNVLLKAVPNPDFNERWTAFETTAECTSLHHARDLCRGFIAKHSLGGGNWAGGVVAIGDNTIARISYNGRVWEPGNYPTPEIHI